MHIFQGFVRIFGGVLQIIGSIIKLGLFLLLPVFFLVLIFQPKLLNNFRLPGFQAERSVSVPRRDIDVSILPNGDVRFNETWQVRFIGGPFRFAFRGIALNKVEAIDRFQISEGSTAYIEASHEDPGTFQVYQDNGQKFVKWFFPPTTDGFREFNVQYMVHGVLRIYDGGDQFWWKAIESDRAYSIDHTTVTVHLPAVFDEKQLKAAITTGSGSTTISDGQTVLFTGDNLTPGKEVEVRVQFPHGSVPARPPSWQPAVDQETPELERRQQQRQVTDLAFIYIGFILLLVGPLVLLVLWFIKGRDPSVAQIAQSSTPPSNLPPGIVGTLIDGNADIKDIISTLVDLARREVLRMIEDGKADSGNHEYSFQFIDYKGELCPYEKKLIRLLFSKQHLVKLSDIEEDFGSGVKELKQDMYTETMKLGFFFGNPAETRHFYTTVGGLGLILFGIIGYAIWAIFSTSTDFAWTPGAALAINSIGLILLAEFMPRRTPKGATEKAKWMAFKRYLQNIHQFMELEQAKELFEKYLPYAISLGLGKFWVGKFARENVPSIPWFRSQATDSNSLLINRTISLDKGTSSASNVARPIDASPSLNMPSLDAMSLVAFQGLDSMSAKIFRMLDATASSLGSTAQTINQGAESVGKFYSGFLSPHEKGGGGSSGGADWSGGGGSGGWSGGGDSGGGGGGGGSSGFG